METNANKPWLELAQWKVTVLGKEDTDDNDKLCAIIEVKLEELVTSRNLNRGNFTVRIEQLI